MERKTVELTEKAYAVAQPENGSRRAVDFPGGVNNAFYEDLGRRWYEAKDDPVALLRAEGRLKHAWVSREVDRLLPGGNRRVLDIGCGAGFALKHLAKEGHSGYGVDRSPSSLRMAREFAAPLPLRLQVADAYQVPYEDASFDVVLALDFLEHVEQPEKVVAEAARLLRPGGLFFFHTFNRNPLAWLIIIKGVEWFVKNTPAHMHVLPLFIKPSELRGYCEREGMRIEAMTGLRPDFMRKAFWKMLATREVPDDFEFVLTSSLTLSYLGAARREA